MATRQRKNPQVASPNNLPPKREGKALQSVSPPGSKKRFSSFIYYLIGGMLLVSAFYAYRITQWKADAGGWWNLALGRRAPVAGGNSPGDGAPFAGRRGARKYGGGKGDVEERINDLAGVLGIQPTDLASAISVAVKEHVAPKTLSSISSSASAAGEKKTAVAALVGDDENGKEGIASGVAGAMGSVVGMDEPMELD
ncbi:hypothetical protein BD410DRAFT_768760 [Rickenella mellea]|uniref:Uncharacterized protein n=1 Tax=Rickenella mellea TaxID=50990 RepID=A0A4Y7Q9I5_9AGAM|nr:hypothetical protein BD410DRAFT_768760 [Rickenella mellea]